MNRVSVTWVNSRNVCYTIGTLSLISAAVLVVVAIGYAERLARVLLPVYCGRDRPVACRSVLPTGAVVLPGERGSAWSAGRLLPSFCRPGHRG